MRQPVSAPQLDPLERLEAALVAVAWFTAGHHGRLLADLPEPARRELRHRIDRAVINLEAILATIAPTSDRSPDP